MQSYAARFAETITRSLLTRGGAPTPTVQEQQQYTTVYSTRIHFLSG